MFALCVVVLLFILPSTIVFALSAVAAYKLIEKRTLKYIVVSMLVVVTFFSGSVWIADNISQPPVATNPIEQMQEHNNESTPWETVPTTSEQMVEDTRAPFENFENKEETATLEASTSTQESTSEPEVSQEQNSTSATYKVVNVVDGDTVKLNVGGAVETIRLIGIDTPETVHPSKPVECFGVEASNKAKAVLSGTSVLLETDSSQGTQDKYGRLLGYIILPDGTNFNKMMIEQGYAYEYTHATPYKYQSAFKAAEKAARARGAGLWAEGVCDEQSAASDTATEQTVENKEEKSTPEESTPKPSDTTKTSASNGTWYVSSHYTSKFYYCEESDGWQSLSERYLEIYDSEAALLADYPNHTLHESCQ